MRTPFRVNDREEESDIEDGDRAVDCLVRFAGRGAPPYGFISVSQMAFITSKIVFGGQEGYR